MADKLQLEVITPEKLALRETVDEVTVPGLGGELGILPNHTPLISQLQTGILIYRKGSEKQSLHVSGGFVEVLPDRVSVLSDVAERPEEIDYERAERARALAEQQLAAGAQGGEGVDLEQARRRLERAIARMELAGQARRR